jgi:hypothetical protein
MKYETLEGNSLSSVGINNTPKFDGADVSFFTTSSFIYTLFFVAILLAAFYEYILVGIYRMEASEAGIHKSNEVFKRTTLGLLGVFSLFLIIFTINKGLLTGNVGLDALKYNGAAGGSQTTTPVQTNPIPQTTPNGTDNTSISGDAAIRQQLANVGITVNNPVCTFVTQLNCTSLGGLPSDTISMLISLKQVCPGAIQVSGGTEAGHSSHGPGKYPVDLSKGNPLQSCIESFPYSSKIPKRVTGADLCFPNKVFEKFGYVFCDEAGSAPHWHVYK